MTHHGCSLRKKRIGADCRGSYHCSCRGVICQGYSVDFNAKLLEHLVRGFNVGSLGGHEKKVDEKVSAEDELRTGVCFGEKVIDQQRHACTEIKYMCRLYSGRLRVERRDAMMADNKHTHAHTQENKGRR